MSYEKLTKALKHLPGQHNQRSHAPHGRRAGVAFSKIVNRVHEQQHSQGNWINKKRAAEMAADIVLEGFRDRQGNVDLEEAKEAARTSKGSIAGATGWGEMFDDVTLTDAIANYERRSGPSHAQQALSGTSKRAQQLFNQIFSAGGLGADVSDLSDALAGKRVTKVGASAIDELANAGLIRRSALIGPSGQPRLRLTDLGKSVAAKK